MQAGVVVTMIAGQFTPKSDFLTCKKGLEGNRRTLVDGSSLEVLHLADNMDLVFSINTCSYSHYITSLVGS